MSELVRDLQARTEKVQVGDLRQLEAMLFGQAMALQTIFTSLARKAVAQEYLKQFQVNLTLALKAQAQCRATLEALAEIKKPRPVAFVKQANFAPAAGKQRGFQRGFHQNRTSTRRCARARGRKPERAKRTIGGKPE